MVSDCHPVSPSSMSFGFSPGDIVLFTKFASNVIVSLNRDGGSKSDFQFAERQCQNFLSVMSVMNELQSLNLKNVPETFRTKINEYAIILQDFVVDFRKAIARYEKSIGNSSERGFFRSAPRKVQ